MSRAVPLLVVGLLAAGLGVLAAPVGGQQKAPRKAPSKVAAPLAERVTGSARFSEVISLAVSDEVERKLDAALDYVHASDWPRAAAVLQWVLDHPEDCFVAVKRKGPDGKETVGWVSGRTEARRLLAAFPPRGLEFYEAAHGPAAAEMLGRARQRGDLAEMARVAGRYPHTPAGREAADLLGTHHLDRGHYAVAARHFAGLLGRADTSRLAPLTFFKAALAFHRAGDTARAEHAWKLLQGKAAGGLTLGERVVGLKELKALLTANDSSARVATLGEWPLFRGSGSRTALGSFPRGPLEVRWGRATTESDEIRGWMNSAVEQHARRGMPALAGFSPITAAGKVVFRSHRGIQAQDRATGELLWESALHGSLERLTDEPASQTYVRAWISAHLASHPFALFENSTVGHLSTDGRHVYAVEDLAILPVPSNYGAFVSRGGAGLRFEFSPEVTNAVYHNRLLALELDGGRIAWEAGGRSGKKERPLDDAHFLGPPLPLGGKLYALLEKEQNVRLACLDALTGRLLWSQPLASPKTSVLLDGARRNWAAHPAHADGVLVCPTNAGAVVAVDLASRGLLWAHSYHVEPPVEMPAVGRKIAAARLARTTSNRLTMNLTVTWRHCAPIVHDGKVLIAGPDGKSLDCLDLWTGALLWREGRHNDDLYLAGVFGDRVLIVTARGCRALRLADGQAQWNVETAEPSGQGVAAGSAYYLPVRAERGTGKPGVTAIDVKTGAVLATTATPDGLVPGNLIVAGGDVLSQTALGITVYARTRDRQDGSK